MSYPNPNRTCKDPNRIRIEIQKYPNEASLNSKTETRIDPNQIRMGSRTSTLIEKTDYTSFWLWIFTTTENLNIHLISLCYTKICRCSQCKGNYLCLQKRTICVDNTLCYSTSPSSQRLMRRRGSWRSFSILQSTKTLKLKASGVTRES